jgi:hypothetical protein
LPYDAPSEAGQFSGNLLPDDGRDVAVSDKDGRFTLRGLGRGWLYDLYVTGPTVVHARAQLVARPQKAGVVGATGIAPPDRPRPQLPLYGSTFTHVAPPCKPIVGVVRDKASGKPLAGFEVGRPWTRDDDPHAWATTDKEGRYKLLGLPGGVHTLQVRPPAHAPYVTAEVRVTADQPGFEPVTRDVAVERQPAATGRVTDRATGKPVAAWVEYRPLARNPNLKANPLLAEFRWGNHPPSAATDRDGRFTLPVLRGPGVLLVSTESNYRPAELAKGDRAAGGVADKADPELIDCRPLLAWPAEYHAYRLIDVPEGKDAEVEIALTPGASRPLVVEFPDGKSRDVTVLGLKPVPVDHGDQYYPGKSAIVGLADGEARQLFLSTRDGQFAAAVVVRDKETGPVTVKLRPTGTITGRVVDGDGKPVVGVSFQTFCDDGPGRAGVFVHGGAVLRASTEAQKQRTMRTRGYYEPGFRVSRAEKTDEQGRFRLDGLLPDLAFDLKVQLLAPPDPKGQRFIAADVSVARPTVKPGETLDLGDLRAVEPPKK